MADKPQTPKIKRGSKAPKNWRENFLRALAECGNISAATRVAGINITTAYDHRNKDPVFAAAWDEAHEESIDALEGEARRRAMETSDTLVMFLLKANRPAKYRDNFRFNEMVEQLARAVQAATLPASLAAEDDGNSGGGGGGEVD